MSEHGFYIIRAAARLRERLDLIVASIIAAFLPVVAVLVAAIIGVIIMVAFAVASPRALVLGVLVLLVLVVASGWVGVAIGYGGLAYAVLDAARGVKMEILEPFKRAWGHKWPFMQVVFALALITFVVLLIALIPLLPVIVDMFKNPEAFMGGERAALRLIARLYALLAPVMAVSAVLKLLLDPSYIYAADEWRGVGDAVSRSLRGAAAMASLDPVSTIAFFTLFLFPDVLLYVFPELFIGNPLASNLFSLLVGAKNIVVEPLFLLAAAAVGRDAGLLVPTAPGPVGPGAGSVEVWGGAGEG